MTKILGNMTQVSGDLTLSEMNFGDGTCKFSHAVNCEPQSALPDDASTLGHGVLSCFSKSGGLFALCTPHKELFIWQTNDWKLLNKREVIRRSTVILFTNKEDSIIVSNKGGDVYRFFVHDIVKEKELLLGHVSMILDMVLTGDDKFLITSDRDEKIRVSCFPNSYNIHTFCLGHLDFVSCLALLSGSQNILVSGGGDGTVTFWNPDSGKEITSKKLEYSTKDVKEENQEEDQLCCPIVSSLTCCCRNSVVCAIIERCKTIYLYHASHKEARTLPSVEASVPPWSAVFDPEGRLWCVQPYPEESVLVFEPFGDLPDLMFVKLTSDFSPLLSSVSDWNYLKGSLNQERKLDSLRKKEVDNLTEYLARKEERMEKKNNKNKLQDNGHAKMDDSTIEPTTEREAKRPKLEAAS
ncbi:tRNA (guanine-N(7)-)-methyltransferase non-catalytic subunit wdr4-like isoform X2 [Stylophora pistillata]|uniref:tRNA (guanine-N(7)-)-methyltransferase non-catalytic subunit wdr4-like isoform X2 n=1 Tax=Stylophora pistillata TaxID=50429 RepID=UPI000C056CA3|nr:tRNA (guanine-N(7)-)-methyltransferase non-catalytic subunit wdr4-like isoform X2 [Stylophora pistillata]